MRSRGAIWVLPRAMTHALSRRFAERGSAEDPRTIWQRMPPFDLARFGGEPKRLRCNAEQTRRLVQIEPWLVPVWRRPKDPDLIMRPERGARLPCPAIAVAGHQAVPVEDAGDQIIIGDENQLADGGEHVGGDAAALSAAAPRQAQFGVNAADPMGQENDL